MNTNLNKELKSYFKTINCLLPYSYSKKKKYLADFKNEIYIYIEENSDVGIEEIKNKFGTSGDIIDSVLEAESGEAIIHSISHNSMAKKIILIVCTLIILASTGISLYNYYQNKTIRNGYWVEAINYNEVKTINISDEELK